jgi:hypothetical protein
MRLKIWWIGLGGMGLICVLAAVYGPAPAAQGLTAFMSFPFAQVSRLLRRLSLAGTWGNGMAVGLYCALSLLPLAPCFRRLVKKKARPEDALLAAMSGFLFYMLYVLINPFLLRGLFTQVIGLSEGYFELGGVILGGAFYSLLIGYLVLRLLRRVNGRETGEMLSWLQRLFFLSAAFLVFSIFYLGTAGLLASIRELGRANTDPDVSLTLTNTFLVLRFGLEQVPALFTLGLLALAAKLAGTLKEKRFGEETVAAATRLGRLCKTAVAATVLSVIAVNLGQLAFGRQLLSIQLTASVPLAQLALTLVLLALAQYFAESNKLHRDNQLFI